MKNNHMNRNNNVSERKNSNGRRARIVRMKKRVLIIASICVVTVTSLFWNSFSVSAQDQSSPKNYKYYKSIQIASGDTLWSIAKEYRTAEYASTADYVSELMRINSLSSDNIQDSQYLTVVYYDKDFKK